MSCPAYGAGSATANPEAHPWSRAARASKSRTAADEATLSESARPRIGMEIRVRLVRHSSDTPSPSEPTTTAVGPEPSPASRYDVAPAGSATYVVKPAAARSARASETSAYSRTGVVSTVPRLATNALGCVTRAVPRVSTSASTAQASAVRIRVPRLPAYSIPSATRINPAPDEGRCDEGQRGSRTTERSAGAVRPGWIRAKVRSEIRTADRAPRATAAT